MKYADLKACPLPHLVLLDLRLPKIDGLEVLKEIKSSDALRHVPTVVLTTSEAESDLARAYQNHANSYLVKPIELNDFTQLMKAISLCWMRHNRTRRQGTGFK